MSGTEILALVAVVALVLFAALLAAAETALTRMSTARAETLGDSDNDEVESLLVRLIERRERAIGPLLFVLLGCHLAAATIIGALAQQRWGASGVIVAFFVALVAIYVIAEAIPKTLALAYPDRTALRLARLVDVVAAVAPLRWFANGIVDLVERTVGRRTTKDVSEEELLALANLALEADAIDADEQELIEQTIAFGDTIAERVMVPRTDMVCVDADFRVVDALEIALFNGFSRLPVLGESIDDVVGVAHLKDLVRADRDGAAADRVDEHMREARFVPDTKRIAKLMREMQTGKFHIAIVVDEYGGTAGVLTLEDLIEELVGEIVDEFDYEEPLIERVPGGLRVNGRAPIDEVNELLDSPLPEGEWATVGGLIFTTLGHVPDEGETVDANGHRLAVERVQGRRIARVRIAAEPAS